MHLPGQSCPWGANVQMPDRNGHNYAERTRFDRETGVELARQIKRLGLQIWPRREAVASTRPSEESLIAALRAGFAALPAVDADASEAEQLWVQFQKEVRHEVLTRDARKFLSWDVITRTMFLAFSVYAARELWHLRRQPGWRWRWKPALRESPVGGPARFPFYPSTSANLVHDAYTLCRFEESTGWSVLEFDEVLEFGGGYGSLCRLFYNLGFSGSYSIYDLAPFSYLQSYYLNSLGIPASCSAHRTGPDGHVRLLSGDFDISQESYARPGKKRLFVAAWSLSETPLAVRERFLPCIANFDGYLIAYQSAFAEVDNHEFFRAWRKDASREILWTETVIPHMPGRHFYLFGVKGAATRWEYVQVAEGAPSRW